MTRFLILAFSLFLPLFGFSQQLPPTLQLENLPGVTVQVLEKDGKPTGTYELMVRQPLDHSDESRGYFHQKVYVSHVGYDRPTVIITEGYSRASPRPYELTELLKANQVQVEHRFFGKSMPDSLDYRFLNLTQATADLHHIRTLLAKMYPEKWVCTGISKGGATTIFYRYLYPDDVTVSVPYVAPINQEYEDQRLYTFLDTIGTDECRAAIMAFQKRILTNREEILPLLTFYSLGARSRYSYISLEEAFEYAVLEYPFSFWQYGHDCSKIPGEDMPLHDALKYLLNVSGIDFFGDASVEQYVSHYYQAATEMGYYGYRTSQFPGLIKALPTNSNPMANFFTSPMEDPFDSKLVDGVNKWLASKKADRMAYINGGLDTWSATGVPENDRVDSEWFVLKGKHHGTARIKEMTAEEKERFVSSMERWLEIKIK
jgi:hypothetical protein